MDMQKTECTWCAVDITYDADDACCPERCADCESNHEKDIKREQQREERYWRYIDQRMYDFLDK